MTYFKKAVALSSAFVMYCSCNTSAASYITATDDGELDLYNALVISSSSSGETISKLSDLSSIYQLSVSKKNDYLETQIAKVYSEEQDSIPVFVSPDLDSSQIGEIPSGSAVIIYQTVGDFAQILFKDTVGFISNENITAFSTTTSTTKYAKITSPSGLNVRSAPSTQADILAVLPTNAYAKVLEVLEGWYKIEIEDSNIIGYIGSSYAILQDTIDNSSSSYDDENEDIEDIDEDVDSEEDNADDNDEDTYINTESPTGQDIVNYAKSFLGTPYVYGGTDLSTGTDCSGFTYSVFEHFNITLNRRSADQYLNGVSVSKDELMPGDLIFFTFTEGGDIGHVAIYIGDGQYIHSTDTDNKGVTISDLDNPYSPLIYYGAKRVLQ